jgi:hypothetical protein
MTNRYILLNALNPDDFSCTYGEMIEALEEFGVQTLFSSDTLGNTTAYATAKNKETLLSMCETVELPGIVLEYTAVYDQAVTI